jgi:hypothetical protein
VQELIDQSRAVPPEFGADVLLRIASSPVVTDRSWRSELLDEAFTFAANAQYPARRVGGPTTSADSRFGPAALATDVGLDRLTLQARAIDSMIRIDAARALRMFRDLHLPDLLPVSCASMVSERVDAYYDLVPKLFAASFTGEQRRKGEDVALVSNAIRFMHADVQVGPVVRMISATGAPGETLQEWLDAFSAALPSVEGSDRTFDASVWLAIVNVAKFAESKGLKRGALLSSSRGWVLRRIHGSHCDDPSRLDAHEPWIQALNAEIETEIARGNGELRLIVPDDVQPGPKSGTCQDAFWWRSSRSQAVLDALRWLNHGNRDLPENKRFWTAKERDTQEWNDRYRDLLRLIGDWNPGEGETAEDVFHMKAITYSTLANLVPPGPQRTNAIRMFLAFLNESYASVQNHAEWFVHAKDVLKSTDPEIRNEALLSPNPIISLYAKVDKRSNKGTAR